VKANNKDSIIVIGSGGHAKVCVDMLQSLNYSIDCCITKVDEPDSLGHIFSVPIITGDEKLPEKFKQGFRKVFIAVGDNFVRKSIAGYIELIGFEFINIVSDKALVSRKAVLGSGILIMPGAIINADAKIGSHSIINTGAVVEHDCLINEYSHIASNAVLCGKVEIGNSTLIGAGSSLLPNVKIGARAKVGAGSVVTNNVLDDQVVFGNPARIRPKVL
jgi:UDP-perosamine 4-acetyltransferase